MAASRRVSSPTLVGRRKELAELRRTLEEMTAGRSQVVVVGGESGVGKTRLVDDAAAELGDRVRVLRGNCLALGSELPYLPFAEMIWALLRELDADGVERIIGPSGSELAMFMPGLGPAASSARPAAIGGSELQRLRMFEALLRVAQGAASDRPTVFVFEDLQWIDSASLQLLSFLTHSVRQGQLLLVLTVRTEVLEAAGPVLTFLAELERNPHIIRIELERLDRESTRRQIGAILGDGVPDDTVDRIWRLGDGNPLFTEELVAADPGRDGVTPRLRDLLGARSARLPAEAQVVLRIAATVGRGVDVELLSTASGLDDGTVRGAVRAGLDEQILVPAADGGGYRFRHELMRATIAGGLRTDEAKQIHAAYAQALMTRRDEADPSEIASHWDGAGESGQALRWHVRAGLSAEGRYAYAVAEHHYERAIESWPSVDDPEGTAGFPRRRLLQRAAASAARSGSPEHAIGLARVFLAENTETEDDLTELVRSSVRWYLWEAGRVEEAASEAREALRRLGDDKPTRWRANALAHLAGLLLVENQEEQAAARAEEALATATACGALEEQVLATGIIGACQLLLGKTDTGIDRIAGSLDAARRIEQEDAALPVNQLDDRRYPMGVVLAYIQLAAAFEIADRNEDVVRTAADGYEAAQRQGVAGTYGATLRAAAVRGLYRLGRWDEALSIIDETLREGAFGSGRIGLLAIASLIHLARGDEGEADDLIRAADDGAGSDRSTEAVRWLAVARAESLIWAGRSLEAVGVIADAYEDGDAAQPAFGSGQAVGLDASLPQLLSLAARAAADLALLEKAGSIEAAASQVALERVRSALRRAKRRPGLADSWAVDLALTNAELARAEHGPAPRAVKRWHAAASIASQRPYVEAYARWRLASALLGDRRRGDEATAELERAHAVARSIGAERLGSAINDLASRAGLARASPAATIDRPFGLTEREVEVLGLLSSGLNNNEIAERLFISPKTASVHVSNIYGKLGVESRVSAASIAQDVGLAMPRDDHEQVSPE